MLRALLAAVLSIAILAPAALAADPTFDVSLVPGDAKHATYRVRITTASEPERFQLRVRSGAGIGRLEGPGTMGYDPGPMDDEVRCSQFFGNAGQRRGRDTEQSYLLSLPAGATSTLVLPIASPSDPLPGERFLPGLSTSNARWHPIFDPYGLPGTLESPGPIAAPPFVPTGPFAVRLTVTTSPVGAFACGPSATPPVNPGRGVTISGTSPPSLAGERVTILVGAPGDTRARTLATVKVRAGGTFVHRGWRPQVVGRYDVAVRYTPGRPDRIESWSRPQSFRLGRPVPLLASLVRRGVRVARGRLLLPVVCPKQAASRCRGRVLAGGVGSVAYDLRPGRRETLRITPRRRLRAGARVAIRVSSGRTRRRYVVRLPAR